ncbi:copper resistance protein CopC [Streptomyces sp. URMC 123]|uniref:copper resistance protein CopC n=1 Tax=Streptomyces sp. URMC 123 TaxID=3423403 RepID=UPI003F1B322A
MPVTAPRSGPRRATALRTAVARLPLLAAALLVALLGGLFGAPPASAHAALTGSDPKQGAVLATAPKDVTLTFSEGVAMSGDSIRVLDPQGKRVDMGELRDMCSGNVIKYGVSLHSGLPNGTFTVAWQAVSADSHPVSGAFTFSIGAPSATDVALPEQQAGGGPVGVLYGIGRYVAYAGYILLIGGAAFVLVCWPRGAGVRAVQRLVVHGWVALTAATLVMLLLRGPYTGSGRLADIADLGALPAVLETKPGAALISRLLLLAAGALFVAVLFGAYARRVTGDEADSGRERRDLTVGLAVGGAIVAIGLAATWALAEHASTGLQTSVAMPVDVLHLLGVAVWLGGVAALLVALHRGPVVERAAVRRFSRLAFASVLVVAATGLYQSWRQVGSWTALTDTSYGRLLLLKVGLVAVLIAVASFSRRWTARLSAVRSPEAEAAAVLEARAAVAAGAGPVAPADSPAAGTRTATAAPADPPAAGTRTATDTPADPPAAEAGAASDAPVDPRRAAQLARQRAALDAARTKRMRDADGERAGLRRSVLIEAAVAVVLLAVTTVLTSTEPARTEEAVRKAAGGTAVPNRPISVSIPFDTGGEDGKGTAQIDLDPGRTGDNSLHVRLSRPNGKPLDAPEVKVSFTLKAQDIGPLPVAPPRVETGHWSATGVQLPMAGDWQMSLTVRTSDIDQVTESKNVKIG